MKEKDKWYIIEYSEPEERTMVLRWSLPEHSFRINYKMMVERGCIVHNVYQRMGEKELLEVLERY